jgi:hypothetical protein
VLGKNELVLSFGLGWFQPPPTTPHGPWSGPATQKTKLPFFFYTFVGWPNQSNHPLLAMGSASSPPLCQNEVASHHLGQPATPFYFYFFYIFSFLIFYNFYF